MNNKLKGIGKSTLRTLAISAFVIIFFVGVILFYYNMVYTKERDLMIKNIETSAVQSATDFNIYISTSLDAIKMTAYTLDGMLADGKSSNEMHDYLVEQSDVIKNTIFENSTGMYAYVNGVYLDGSDWVPPDDYVPTERPWFKDAINANGEVAVVDPYVDALTGDVMITLAKSLSDGKSVVAFDMSLEKIQSITEEAVSSELADIEFIIDSSGSVMAHSDKSEVNRNYSEETGPLMFVAQIITCITVGIFFGYAYMKTQNIWVVTIMHYLNNNLVAILAGGDPSILQNQIVHAKDIPIMIVQGIVFAIFIISPIYGKLKKETETE